MQLTIGNGPRTTNVQQGGAVGGWSPPVSLFHLAARSARTDRAGFRSVGASMRTSLSYRLLQKPRLVEGRSGTALHRQSNERKRIAIDGNSSSEGLKCRSGFESCRLRNTGRCNKRHRNIRHSPLIRGFEFREFVILPCIRQTVPCIRQAVPDIREAVPDIRQSLQHARESGNGSAGALVHVRLFFGPRGRSPVVLRSNTSEKPGKSVSCKAVAGRENLVLQRPHGGRLTLAYEVAHGGENAVEPQRARRRARHSQTVWKARRVSVVSVVHLRAFFHFAGSALRTPPLRPCEWYGCHRAIGPQSTADPTSCGPCLLNNRRGDWRNSSDGFYPPLVRVSKSRL